MSNLLHKGRQSSSLKAANRGKAKVKRLNLEIYRGTERARERERDLRWGEKLSQGPSRVTSSTVVVSAFNALMIL